MRAQGAITTLLHRHRAGDRGAYDELVALVYDELRRIARGQLARGWPTSTLTSTALVHEAYLRLADERRIDWQGRSHFFAICARAMRRLLVDRARRHAARKRAGDQRFVALGDFQAGIDWQPELTMAVDEALTSLERFNGRLARVVECRYFAGLTEEETARALETPLRTVQRDWTRARAWLLKELGPAAGRSADRP